MITIKDVLYKAFYNFREYEIEIPRNDLTNLVLNAIKQSYEPQSNDAYLREIGFNSELHIRKLNNKEVYIICMKPIS